MEVLENYTENKKAEKHQGEGKCKLPLRSKNDSLIFQFYYVLSCKKAF